MIVIEGKSASGKSTVEKYLKSHYNYKKIISYTTRAIRSKEIDGVDYHYISKDKFLQLKNLNFFAEFVENYGNYYGVSKEDCLDDSIVVVEQHGLEQLKEVDGLKIKSFYLYQTPLVRLKRMYKRGDKLKDIIKRMISDDIKFFNAKKDCDYILKTENVEDTCDTINNIVQDKSFESLKFLIGSAMTRDVMKDLED